jgi:23S rRNA pseudouridine1911/1915/1917 synthase
MNAEQAERRAFSPARGDGRSRLDAFLSRELAGFLSREKIKAAIEQGQVSLNRKPCTRPKTLVEYGDSVEIDFSRLNAGAKTPAAENLPLKIIYQDADLAVINKPAGLTVHPCPSRPDGTLVNRLLAHFPELAGKGGTAGPVPGFAQQGERPGIVHRLDKDTTGLLLVALNEASRLKLAAAFAAREVKKEYLALVYGVPDPAEGGINVPIGRDAARKTRMTAAPNSGRAAFSEYRTLYAGPAGRFSLLAVRIHTGRTHQIRVHLRHLGHPILGDALYFDPKAASGEMRAFVERIAKRPLLHAWKIAFPHPAVEEIPAQNATEKLFFSCPPPEDFYSAALALSGETPKAVLTGNAGCGKSSVLKLLAQAAAQGREVVVWNADQAVAALYEQGGEGWRLLRSAFGTRFVPDERAGVDKKALFEAMFHDESLRREVEALIHPLVSAETKKFFRQHDFWNNLQAPPQLTGQPKPAKLAVAEIPLYFEAAHGRGENIRKPGGSGTHCTDFSTPLVIGVHCPQNIRARRLKTNRNWPDSMIEKMESWQWEENKKMQACDLVLDNSGTPEQLAEEVKKVLLELEELYARRLQRIRRALERLGAT